MVRAPVKSLIVTLDDFLIRDEFLPPWFYSCRSIILASVGGLFLSGEVEIFPGCILVGVPSDESVIFQGSLIDYFLS